MEDQADLAQQQDPGPALHVFPLRSNGMLPVGIRNGAEVALPIRGLTVGLIGPGATGVARAMAITLLTHAGDYDIELVVAVDDASRVLGMSPEDVQAVAQDLSAVTLTKDLDTALRAMESEQVHRARLLNGTEGQADLSAVRAAHPDEPLPHLVLLAAPDANQHRRLATLSAASREYDMAVLTLGDFPAGTNLTVTGVGRINDVSGPDADLWRDLQLFHIAEEDAAQILATVRQAHGAAAAPPHDHEAADTEKQAERPETPPPHQDPGKERPAQLRVLGPPALIAGTQELTTGIRGKARELATYLALHPHGVGRDVILEALYPNVDLQHAVMRFHAAVNDIRSGLRKATGLHNEDFVVAAPGYRIDAELIEVDLWQFKAQLNRASSQEGAAGAALLERAMELYTGDLAAQQPYDWAEAEREALRRQAIHALIVVAELLRENEPERALAALERAISIDPYGEDAYRRLMAIQARLEDRDGVRRTYRQLESRLEELNVDPDEETRQLYWRLLHRRRNEQPRNSQ